MTTKMKSISVKGLMHDVDIMVSFDTDIDVDAKVNFTALVDHIAQQFALAGMQRIKTANGQGTRNIREKTGANGGHPLDPLPFANHNCPNCDAPLGVMKVKEFKGGPNKGKPGYKSVHLEGYKEFADCKPIFLAEGEYHG